MPYIYFVSYAHGRGFGSCAIPTTGPVNQWDDISAIRAAIAASPLHGDGRLTLDEIAILNFILLSGPDLPSED